MIEQLLFLACFLILGMGLTIYELKHRNGVLERHIKQQDKSLEFQRSRVESLQKSGKELLDNYVHQNRAMRRMQTEQANGK